MRRRSRGTGQVGEALNGLFGAMESGTKLRESMALAYWSDVVGAQAAAASEAETIRDGILFVRTKSSVWSHELTFLKAHILAELNRRIGRPIIKEIIYRAQGVKKPVESAPTDHPTDDDLKLVVFSPSEQAALDQELDALSSITDDKMRDSVRTRILRDRRLRRWRLDHGWRECSGCQAVHNTDGDLCPICRLCR
jgi:predicted nucleic acid-binding Zn ribbon protein